MKRFFCFLPTPLAIFILALGVISCQKEEVPPPETTSYKVISPQFTTVEPGPDGGVLRLVFGVQDFSGYSTLLANFYNVHYASWQNNQLTTDCIWHMWNLDSINVVGEDLYVEGGTVHYTDDRWDVRRMVLFYKQDTRTTTFIVPEGWKARLPLPTGKIDSLYIEYGL